MKYASLIVMILGVCLTSFTYQKGAEENSTIQAKKDKIEWLSFNEGLKRSKEEHKKIFIDVYTDWCGYCKIMDKNTFNDSAIASYLNEKFVTVKFNAEQREPITFNGHTFKYVESGSRGYHELAVYLLNSKLSYPTTVFLDENQNMIFPVPGYWKPDDFKKVINYVGEEKYKSTPWKDYEKNYDKDS